MLEVAVLDCCGPDDSQGTRKYVAFLHRKFDGRVHVSFYDPEQQSGPEVVPPALFERLTAQGVNSVPVLVIDGEVVCQGSLPDWIESMELIERRINERSTTGASTPERSNPGEQR